SPRPLSPPGRGTVRAPVVHARTRRLPLSPPERGDLPSAAVHASPRKLPLSPLRGEGRGEGSEVAMPHSGRSLLDTPPPPGLFLAAMVERRWTIYILRCGDGSLYTGITDRLAVRLARHAAGK